MNHEFSPTAPQRIGTEVGVNKISALDAKLEGSLLVYRELAKQRYIEAIALAEEIDDREQTSIPFNRNAVHIAMLTTYASLRGAKIA